MRRFGRGVGAGRTALVGLAGLGALLLAPSGGAAQERGDAVLEIERGETSTTDAALEIVGATSDAAAGAGSGRAALAAGDETAETEAPEGLLRDRVDRAEDLAHSLPALRVDAPFLTNPNLYVRGIGQQHFYDDFVAPVAVYVDGVYAPSAAGQLLESFDLSGATLLKGAQGSLYARNATAGALLLRSNLPDGEFSGTTSIRYGNYDQFEVTGALGFPLIEEVLSARVAGAAHFRNGVTKNNCAGAPPEPADPRPTCDLLSPFWFNAKPQPDLFPIAAVGDFDGLERWTNDVDNWAARGLLRFQPADAHDWLLKVHGERNRGDSRHLQMLGTDRNSGGNFQGFSEDNDPRFDTDPFVGWYDQDGSDRLDRWGAALTGDIDLGAAHLTSITGYVAKDHLVQDEGDATPGMLLATDWSDESWQLSQELRLEGEGAHSHWTFGGEFLYEDVETSNVFKFVNLDYVNQSIAQTFLSFAPYFRASWELGDFWSVALGGRYNWEQRSFELGTAREELYRLREPDPSSPTGYRYKSGWDACCGDGRINLALDPISTRSTGAAPTGDLTINFAPTDDVLFYAKYTRGWKGAQIYGESDRRAEFQAIHRARPESVNAVEGGIRSSWLDAALGFEAAVFYADYGDQQVFDMANEVDRLPVKRLVNSEAEVLGVDAEFTFRPVPDLFAQVSFGWLDTEYVDLVLIEQKQQPFKGPPKSPIRYDYSGNPLVNAPRYRLSGRVDYTARLARYGALLPSFFFRYQSKTYLDIQQRDQLSQPAFWVLDARLAYRTPGEHVEIAGWVRNLLDEHYRTDAFDQSVEHRQLLYVYADPRLYGMTVSFQW
jgi:iron complex outermembrane receptor protein